MSESKFSTSDIKKDTILVVDDIEINRIILEEILCGDYIIEQAESGSEALSKLISGEISPSLVLLDIIMPEMSGFDVFDKMKEDDSLKNIPVIFLTAENTEEYEVRGLNQGASDYITKPVKNIQIVKARIANHVELYKYRSQLEVLVTQKANQLTRVKDRMLESLATFIEDRNLESGEHVKRTSMLTQIMLDFLIGDPKFYEQLKNIDYSIITKACALHDIGKIAIPDKILLKPGKLTPEEFKVIETHTTIGSAFIDNLLYEDNATYLRHCHDICRHHHERWDGKGYPDKLSGSDIPISARIVAIVDVYDALVSERVYKPAMPHEKAIAILKEGAGTQFDPDMIALLLKKPELFDEVYK